MDVGRTLAAAALAGAAALPLTAAVSWSDAPDVAPAPERPAQEPVAQPAETVPAPPEARPVESRPALPDVRPAEPRTDGRGQVSQRPVGAPETGGGPEEAGFGPAWLG
ncbi:hypothetical protein ACFFRS_24140, partial [Saccharopolyspora hordei]